MSAKYVFMLAIMFSLISTVSIQAHCDGLDGPVVKAAQKALETGNVNYVLIWVNENNEKELKEGFEKAYSAKNLNSGADKSTEDFYELLVKLHRETEGEEFTGVKPAGRYKGTAIPLADKAIEINKMDPLKEVFNKNQIAKLKKYFDTVIERKNYDVDNVKEGRKYVSAYVEFFHHLEHLSGAHKEG